METPLSLSGAPGGEPPTVLGRLRHVWSCLLFPGTAMPHASGRSVRACELVLLLAAGLLCFWRIDCPLQEPEETLYAEVPRQMLTADQVMVPVRHGQAYYDKPPLLYWLVMVVYQLFGIHDWAARLVPSSAVFLSVLVTYAWGKRMVGPRAAFAGALVLCLSPRFIQMGRMLTTNGLLTLWVTAALAAAHLAIAGPTLLRPWWLLSAVVAGVGLLTKGPVALALVGVPTMLYQLLDSRSARVGTGWWAGYFAVAGVIAVPWFVVVAVRDPAFVDYFFWTHHIRRFVDPIDHPQPAWYYLPLLFTGMLPWMLLLPGLAWHLARRPSDRIRGLSLPFRTGPVGFALLAGLWCVAFFSASGCKRPSYILPAMPALALVLGSYADTMMSLGPVRRTSGALIAGGMFLGLFGACEFLLPGYSARYSLRDRLVPHVEACDTDVPILCYPHGWDAVSYYLQRSDVQVFRQGQLGAMVSTLGKHSQSFVVVKSDQSLRELVAALPDGMAFVESSRDGTVAVGWVRKN